MYVVLLVFQKCCMCFYLNFTIHLRSQDVTGQSLDLNTGLSDVKDLVLFITISNLNAVGVPSKINPQIKISLFQISIYYLGRNRTFEYTAQLRENVGQKSEIRDLSGGPVVNSPSFQRRGQKFIPCLGTKIRVSHGMCKT